jgi:hypothetical protein
MMPIETRDSSGRWRQFDLGTHKVQQLKSAKSIVLPAYWCRVKDLQKGDPIDFYLLPDGNLLLKPATPL